MGQTLAGGPSPVKCSFAGRVQAARGAFSIAGGTRRVLQSAALPARTGRPPRRTRVSQKPMSGVFPILVTPFDEEARVDETSLRSLVEFELAAGVDGLGVALGSEILLLTEAERVQVTRAVVDQVRGRVPVVIKTGAGRNRPGRALQPAGPDGGADALMVMPATAAPAAGAEVREYYRAIARDVDLPIFIQDTSGSHVGAETIRQLAEECVQVRYVKVESAPTPLMVQEAVSRAGSLVTVFGGAGGDTLIEELRRGSRGTMPGCSNPEAFVEVWRLYKSGDERGAWQAFCDRILPLNRLAAQGWNAFFAVHKEVLRQRGAIRCATVRGPSAPLDPASRRELELLVHRYYPELRQAGSEHGPHAGR